MSILYENIIQIKQNYYERVFDTETHKSSFNKIDVTPKLYVPHPTGAFTYFLDKTIKLDEKVFENDSALYKWCRTMNDAGLPYYGKTTPKYQYVRDNFFYKDKVYINNDHKMRVWQIDIEVSQEFGFPYPHKSIAPVTLIQFHDSFDDRYYVIGYKDIEGHENPKDFERVVSYNKQYNFPENTTYLKVSDEIEMFRMFIKLIHAKNPAIWSAWNGDLFDYPYLVKRMEKIGLKSDELSPLRNASSSYSKDKQGFDSYTTEISGIYLLDLMELYKKFTFTPQTSYSLNNISKEELGAEKVEYSEFENLDALMNSDYNRFVKYGIVDVQLTKEIDEKLNLINLVKSIAYKMGICLDDALGTVKPWGTYINNVAYNEGFILPNDGTKNIAKHIKGAWVADPVIGKHNWIVSFDWASLYPSIIRWGNFSPETWIPDKLLPKELLDLKLSWFVDDEDKLLGRVDEIMEKITPLLVKHNVSVGINGAFYRRDEIGLIPRLIKQLYAERKASKKEMFVYTQLIQDLKKNGGSKEDIKKAENQEAFYDTQQMTQKILLNSLYGALANEYFCLFNADIAASVTGNGRFTNKSMAVAVNDMLKTKLPLPKGKEYLIYGDTDSFYLTIDNFVKAKAQKTELSFEDTINFCDNVCEKIIQPFVNDMTQKIGNALNIVENGPMAMDREIIADSGIFIAKKRYIARVLDTEGVRLKEPKKKIMGLEIVRSSTPKFCRKYLKESIDILLDGDEESLQLWVSDVKKKFMESPIEDISRVTGVNKISHDFRLKTGTEPMYKKDDITGELIYPLRPVYDKNGVPRKKAVFRPLYSVNDEKSLVYNDRGDVIVSDEMILSNGFKVFNNSLYYISPDGEADCSPVPINSRASMVHNIGIKLNQLEKEYTLISEKDKIKYCMLKTPNVTNSDVFGYLNPSIIEKLGLTDRIDKDEMWQRFFTQSLDIMITPLKWSYVKKASFNDWI